MAAAATKANCKKGSQPSGGRVPQPDQRASEKPLANIVARAIEPRPDTYAQWEAEERARRLAELLRPLETDLGTAYANLKLADYEIYDARQQTVVDRLRKIFPTMPAMVNSGRGLVWAGATGTGKDFLAAATAIATVRIHGIHIRRLNARKLAIASFDNAERLVEEMARATVLIVSDPAPNSLMQIDRLFALMSQREENSLPTWVTINGGPDEIESSLGPALFGRFVKNSETFFCDWEDFRQRSRRTAPRP